MPKIQPAITKLQTCGAQACEGYRISGYFMVPAADPPQYST